MRMTVPAKSIQLDDIMRPDTHHERVLAVFYSTPERKRVQIIFQDTYTPPEESKEAAWNPKYMIEIEREVSEEFITTIKEQTEI